jgi:Pro-kumamolisin, activation domain/Fibronectin type III domain
MTTIDVCPLVAKSTLVSAMETSKTIGVVLALPSSDPAGLKAFVDHVSTPGDPLYRQFITPQEFASMFGGSASDYQFLKDWAVSNNLTVSQESVGRTTLTLRGSVAVLNRLFKTQVNNYITSDGATFYSAGVAATVPAEISSKVVAVIGLTSGRPNAALAKVGKTLGEHPAPNSALKPAGRTEALGTGNGSIWGSGFGIQLLLGGKQSGTPAGPLVVGLKSPATSTSATIKWTTSSAAVGYAIGLYHAGGLFNIVQGYVEKPPKTALTLTNLIPNTAYNVFVWGFNASGGSANPATASFTTAQ